MKGSRTVINGSKSNVYRGLGRKGNEKKEEDDCWSVNAWTVDGSRALYIYEKALKNPMFMEVDGN